MVHVEELHSLIAYAIFYYQKNLDSNRIHIDKYGRISHQGIKGLVGIRSLKFF
jgi:hypothetical protein